MRIYSLLLHLIVLSIPLVIYGISLFGVSWRLSRIFLVLALPFLFIRIKERSDLFLRDKFLIYGILPFLCYVALSLAWTPHDSVIFGLNRLMALIEVIFLYVLVVMADVDQVKFNSFVKTYLASAILPLLVSFWQITNNFIQFSIAEVPFQNLLIPGKYESFKDRTFLLSNEGYTRLVSSFGEPTIFGSFLSSVLLVSLLYEAKNKGEKIALIIFQSICFLCLMLSLSKLALVTIIFGLIIIFRKKLKSLMMFISVIFVILGISYTIFMSSPRSDYVAKRFFSDSGHLTLIKHSINELKKVNLVIGAGIGSIPGFSTNKFLLSRLYESGMIGLAFAIFISVLPFMTIYKQNKDLKTNEVSNVCFGVFLTILLGFHLYDLFIYSWPWILIGVIMSRYYHLKYSD